MFEKLISVFIGTSRNSRIFQLLIILAIIFIVLTVYKTAYKPTGKEGFSQSDRYILKENTDIYDDFYSHIYDKLMLPKDRATYIISKVIELTEPSTQYSSILDVGSGTGHLLNLLSSAGYKAYGIDKSQAMVDRSNAILSNVPVKCKDVLDPITYDRGAFTHILCVGMTIYEITDIRQFFQNTYFWLQGNGYLILQLVDRSSFDTVIPGGNIGKNLDIQKYAENRITDTMIDYIDFTYKSSYKFKGDGKTVVHKEIFTDNVSQSIRENERALIIEDPNKILQTAIQYGYTLKGKVSTDKPGEYLYILERLA